MSSLQQYVLCHSTLNRTFLANVVSRLPLTPLLEHTIPCDTVSNQPPKISLQAMLHHYRLDWKRYALANHPSFHPLDRFIACISNEQALTIQWQSTQQQLQQTIARNNFGLSVPLRQAMELKIVNEVCLYMSSLLSGFSR